MLNNQEISAPVQIKDLGNQYPTFTSKTKVRFGIYKCSCGNEFRANSNDVKRGAIKSCGCYRKIRQVEANTTHGLNGHKLYSIFRNMVNRTEYKNGGDYQYYGGRGIIVCKEWRNNFKSFYDWAMQNGWNEGLTIDRINNDGNYEPSNCRWASRTLQMRNTRLLYSSNKSGYRGVTWNKRDKRWYANIRHDNKQKHIGCFLTAIEAAKAYDNYVKFNSLEHPLNNVL